MLGVLVRPTLADDFPVLQSKAVVVLDAKTGTEIFGKEADSIRGIASTTKIFVALVVRKKGIALDDWTEINKVDVKAARGGARTRLDPGRSFRNRDLMRAMLMASDNRAPTALGRAVGLSPDELVAAMNQLAKDLGLTKTKFTCTSGLRGNESTAREMSIALKAALEDKVLRDIMAEQSAIVVSKDKRARIQYSSTNLPLVSKRFDVVGGKTGYTKAAGYCYITAARFAGREVVLAFLGAQAKATRFEDFNKVAAWLAKRNGKLATDPKRPEKRVANP